MQPKFMPWVDLLPEVGDPIRNERNKLAAKLAEAEELERQAAALRAAVREGRAALLDRVMKQWTLHDIEQAATAAADRGRSGQCAYPSDLDLLIISYKTKTSSGQCAYPSDLDCV